jgi:hypothetical protein
MASSPDRRSNDNRYVSLSDCKSYLDDEAGEKNDEKGAEIGPVQKNVAESGSPDDNRADDSMWNPTEDDCIDYMDGTVGIRDPTVQEFIMQRKKGSRSKF